MAAAPADLARRPHVDDADSLSAPGDESFRDLEWVAFHGGEVVAATALAYFRLSPFYKPQCNNEISGSGGDPGSGASGGSNLNLSGMKGLEYRVQATEHASLFIITEQVRSSRTLVRRLAVYYILDNAIYASPSLEAVVVARFSRCRGHLHRALDGLNEICNATPSLTALRSASEAPPDKERVERARRRGGASSASAAAKGDAEVRAILASLVKKFAPEAALQQQQQ